MELMQLGRNQLAWDSLASSYKNIWLQKLQVTNQNPVFQSAVS